MTVADQELAERVHSLALRFLRELRGVDLDTRLSPARLSVLATLVMDGPMTVGELAAAEAVKAPTMSRLVTALERTGYVRREPDTADGRRVTVVVTESGVQEMEEARRRRVGRVASILSDLDADQRRTLLDAAETLESALEQTVSRREAAD